MRKLLGMLGAVVGGWIGWYVGSAGGFFVAFLASVVGTGFGMYAGYRLAARYS